MQRDLGGHVAWTVRSLQRAILAVTDRFKAPEHVLMSGKPSGDGPKQIEWARQTLEQASFGVVADIQPGEPETVIGQAIQSKGIDLLVMGAYTHSPWRQLFTGSKTTELLRAAKVPTLLLR